MDRCIMFYENQNEHFRLRDSYIEFVSQLSLYRNIIVKQIESSKKIAFCLHCVLHDNQTNRDINFGIYFDTGNVVFTVKQKLFEFDSAINYYENFIKDRNFKLKLMESLCIHQREI